MNGESRSWGDVYTTQKSRILELEAVARGLKQCCEEYRAEIAALEEQAQRLGDKWAGEQIARARERDEARAEVAALREAALDLIDEINKHPISSTISSTSIHYFKRTLSDRCPARPKAKP